MINKWKIVTVAALMTVGLAAPAFAQSADHTGSQMPHYFDSNGTEIFGSWGPQAVTSSRHVVTRRSGLNAFARIPDAAFDSRGQQATGGGSIGYNENLRTDQW
jgi:hypothetical protein